MRSHAPMLEGRRFRQALPSGFRQLGCQLIAFSGATLD
jgi:hypothetical protein